MSRIRGKGRSSKQAARCPSKIRAPLPLSIRSNSFLQSHLISRLCKLQGEPSAQEGRQEQEDGQHAAAAAAPAALLILPPICGRPAGPSLLLFPLPRLSPSLIHLHEPYTTAQHQPGNNQTRKKHPVRLLFLAQICFTYCIIDRALKYQTVLLRRSGLAATSKTESFIYFCYFMNLWACR